MRITGRLFIISVLLLFSMCSAATAEPKRVLLLHSFGRDFKPWSEYAKSIRLELTRQSPWPLDITEHSLVTARAANENPELPFVEYLRALSGSQPPDLIVAIGAPAAAFIQRHRQRLFAAVPMVLSGVDHRRVQYSSLSANDSVVAVRINYFAAVENILQVLPDTKKVTVVLGTSPIEKFWREEMDKELRPLADRIEFTWTNDLSFEEILKRAAGLPPQSAIFWAQMAVDAVGVVHEGDAALTRLQAVASAPIFSYNDAFFGRELVGGPLLSVTEGGRQTASVAIRILGGEKAGDIKLSPIEFATPKFDWRELQRWKISESRLPAGSEVHFRQPTLWEQYRWQIVAVAAVMLLQAALILGLMLEHRRRRRLEVEGRQRMAELAHMNRQATAGQLSASIAHELNQPLGAILNNVEAASVMLVSPSPNLEELKTILDDIKRDDERASKVIKRLRRLFTRGGFDPQEVDLNKVVRDVVRIASAQAAAHAVKLDSNLAEQPLRVKGDKVQLQQVILNLIVNGIDAIAETPNGVREITSRSWASEGHALVSIRDTGPGIPSDRLERLFEPFFTTKQDGMGMGLCIADTIIQAHGGKISAENRPSGAVFHVSLPLYLAKAKA